MQTECENKITLFYFINLFLFERETTASYLVKYCKLEYIFIKSCILYELSIKEEQFIKFLI